MLPKVKISLITSILQHADYLVINKRLMAGREHMVRAHTDDVLHRNADSCRFVMRSLF